MPRSPVLLKVGCLFLVIFTIQTPLRMVAAQPPIPSASKPLTRETSLRLAGEIDLPPTYDGAPFALVLYFHSPQSLQRTMVARIDSDMMLPAPSAPSHMRWDAGLRSAGYYTAYISELFLEETFRLAVNGTEPVLRPPETATVIVRFLSSDGAHFLNITTPPLRWTAGVSAPSPSFDGSSVAAPDGSHVLLRVPAGYLHFDIDSRHVELASRQPINIQVVDYNPPLHWRIVTTRTTAGYNAVHLYLSSRRHPANCR